MDDGGSQQSQQFSLTATKGTKNIGSRTAIVNGQTIWSLDDEIYVSSEDGKVTGVLKINPETLNEDKTTATFTGYVSGAPSKLAYSVFPAPKNGKIIDLSTIEGGGEVDAPFIGKINQDDDVDVHFNHVGGVAPIVMNGYQRGDIVINATNNNSTVKFLKELDVTKVEFLNGQPVFIDIDKAGQDETTTITITSPKGGQMYVPYYLKSSTTPNGNGKKIVEFKHGEEVVNRADLTDGFVGKVHASTVVAYTYKEDGTSVENKSTEPKLKEEGGTSTAVVDQDQFSSINETEAGEDPAETKYFNVSAVVTKPAEGATGKTETVVAEAVEVTLPKVEVSEGNEKVERSVEISFTNVTSSTTITIQEEEATSSEGEKSIDNLTIVLPSGTTEEEAKKAVEINMPNTTVTIKSDDGNVLLIKEMTAETADQTLIIDKDVEITSLTIKKGSVQVFGKIGQLKRDSHNPDEVTEVIIEVGGEVKQTVGNEFNVVNKNQGQVVPTAFAKYLQETYGADKVTIDANGNPIISADLAKEVTELNLNGQGTFETLAGIEQFTNLERLTADNVGLKSINVSNNLALEYLDISNNSGITSLDVTRNVNLTNLLMVFSQIPSLDLSKNVNLEGLLLVAMPLETLDLTNNTKIESLNCRECKIPVLDITPLTSLRDLYCGGQQENIDIKVTMTKSQKELWDADWFDNWENERVTPVVEGENEDSDDGSFVEESDGTYTIYGANGWNKFATRVNGGETFAGKTVKLGGDIDLNNELQEPIGVQEELNLDEICFAGTLDGQNHSIKNLKIDNTKGRFTGLFAFVQGATFKNLRLVGGEVKGTGTTSSMYVGAFLGYGYGVTFINCHNEGCKVVNIYEKNSGYAGGIAGSLNYTEDNRYSYIIACTNSAEVSGAYCPSGITGGDWNGYVSIVACANTGKISYSGTQLDNSNIYASGISGALGGSNNWMYGCFTDCEVEPGQGHSALVSDAGSSHVNFHHSYSANTSMSLLAAWGGPYTSDNETLGYSSYNDAVDNLNEGILMYNESATVPCTYHFVKGDKPTLEYGEPSPAAVGNNASGNNFGDGGVF